MSTQALSAPISSLSLLLVQHRGQDERQPPQSSWPVPICTQTIAKSGYLYHAVGNVMCLWYRNASVNKMCFQIVETRLLFNCSTPLGLTVSVNDKIQDAIQYKDHSPDCWRLAHTMMSARAWGRSNRLLTAAICNTGVVVDLTRQ